MVEVHLPRSAVRATKVALKEVNYRIRPFAQNVFISRAELKQEQDGSVADRQSSGEAVGKAKGFESPSTCP